MLSLSSTAMAQNLESGYFTDGYLYAHDLNPAFGSNQGYFSMPALGSFNIDVRGTLGLSDLLYLRNGKTVTFLNPSVTSAEFKSHIKDENKFNESLRMQILSFGFKGFGGYNTFEVNVRQELSAALPGDLFVAMKDGLTNSRYDFSQFGANADAFAEVALGHSHQIGDKLRIGAKAKLLLSVGHFEANFNKAELNLGKDSYTADVDAEVRVGISDLTFEHDVNENTNHKYVSGIDDVTPGVAGMGFAVDLGAEYKITDDLAVSAALLDLGTIKFNKTFVAAAKGKFDTQKYIFNTDDDATHNFDDELDKMSDDLSKLYELDDKGDQGSTSVGIGATFRAGVEYKMPFYNKLSVGLLNTTRMGNYSFSDFRFSANIAPVKFLSAGFNITTGTYGTGFGWIFNFHPNGLNLYVAMDRMLGSLSKQYVPLNSNASFSMGLNFPF